jgi:LysR family transcriptional regulator for bpeEF and oprC
VSERHADLIAENIDLAVRAGELRDASAVAQRVGQTPLLCVASASYLETRGEPRTPAELDRHDGVVFVSRGSRRPWRFGDASPEVVHPGRASFVSSNAEEIRAAVAADLGIAQVPGWLVAQELRADTIRVVLRPYEPPPLRISFVRPARRTPARVRAVADVLLQEFAREPLLGIRTQQP